MPLASEPATYEVVLACVVVTADHVEASELFSMRYPVIGVPPLTAGALQLRVAAPEDATADKELIAEGRPNGVISTVAVSPMMSPEVTAATSTV